MPYYQLTVNGKVYKVNASSPEEARRKANQHAAAQGQQAATQGPLEHDFDAMNMVKNIPGSALELGKDLVGMVTSPVQTAKGIAALGGSALAKGQRKVRELASGVDIEPEEDEAVADAVWEAAVGRYGGIEELQRTMENDPVGFMADFSGALGAAGKASKLNKLGKVAQMVDPVTLPGVVAKAAVKYGVPEGTARGLYQSAAKFPTTMKNRDQVTQLALDKRILPTKRGAAKLEERLAGHEANLDALIADATSQNKKIPVEKVYQHMDDLLDSKYGFLAEGGAEQNRIIKVFADADDSLKGRTNVSPAELQKFKTDLYTKIYNRRRSPEATKREGIKTEAQSALARGAKDALSEAVPETAIVNQHLSDLYRLRMPIDRASSRIENTNKIPARAMFGGAAAGGAAAGNPMLAALTAATAWIVDNPAVKSRMAQAINSIKRGRVGKAEKILNGSREIRMAMILAERNEDELKELGILD